MKKALRAFGGSDEIDRLQASLDRTILEALALPALNMGERQMLVRQADKAVFAGEVRSFFDAEARSHFGEMSPPWPRTLIRAWTPTMAEERFLARYETLRERL